MRIENRKSMRSTRRSIRIVAARWSSSRRRALAAAPVWREPDKAVCQCYCSRPWSWWHCSCSYERYRVTSAESFCGGRLVHYDAFSYHILFHNPVHRHHLSCSCLLMTVTYHPEHKVCTMTMQDTGEHNRKWLIWNGWCIWWNIMFFCSNTGTTILLGLNYYFKVNIDCVGTMILLRKLQTKQNYWLFWKQEKDRNKLERPGFAAMEAMQSNEQLQQQKQNK